MGSWSPPSPKSVVDKVKLAEHELAEMPKFPRFAPSPIRAIEALIFPAVQLLDVTGPVQVFASANDIVANAGGAPPYRIKLVTQGDQGVVSSAGVTLLAAGPLSQRGKALDTFLIAGGPGGGGRCKLGTGRLGAAACDAGASRCVSLYRRVPARRHRSIGRTPRSDPLEGLRQAGSTLSGRARRA